MKRECRGALGIALSRNFSYEYPKTYFCLAKNEKKATLIPLLALLPPFMTIRDFPRPDLGPNNGPLPIKK